MPLRTQVLGLVVLGLSLFNVLALRSAAQDVPPAAPPLDEPVVVAPADEPAVAESAVPAAEAKGDARLGSGSILDLLRQANPMLWPLVLCSVVTIGYILERRIALRKSRVIPHEFTTRFIERLESGKLDKERAAELCRGNDSVSARLFGRIVQRWGQPPHVIRELAAQDAAIDLADLKRNVRVLNGTATLGPLLGLLGTVVGMIEAFDSLAGDTAGGISKNQALAHGIALALLATAFGLVIAIVSITFYYYFLNRIDWLTRDLDIAATRVVDLVASDTANRTLPDTRRPPLGTSVGADYARPDRGL